MQQWQQKLNNRLRLSLGEIKNDKNTKIAVAEMGEASREV